MSRILDQELTTFRRELPGLLADPANRDRYALVYGEAVDSVWPTLEAALAAGYDRYGLLPFLAKRIVETESPRFVSYRVGV